MISIGYKRRKYNCCVYVRSLDDGSITFLLLYVDDMLNAGKSMDEVNKLKSLLSKEFDMKDFRVASKILGIEIRRDRKSRRLWLSQAGYIEKVFERFNMGDVKLVKTPLVNHFSLSTSDSPKTNEDIQKMSNVPYTSAV